MTATPDRAGTNGAIALRRVEKPATVRCLGPVDAGALAAQVARLSERAWRLRDTRKENRFRCFHHTQHIAFRFIDNGRDPRRFYSWPGWRLWRRWLLPVMECVAATYRFAEPVYPKAMLARLEARQHIDTHIDGRAGDRFGSNPFVHKIHVPLETSPAAVVSVADATTHLAPGYAWEINNLAPHGAFNGGNTGRIHFIFEVFDGAGHQVTEEIRPLGFVGLPPGWE